MEPKRISDAALARLEQFSFPGNVRQLENICHWLTVMAPAQVISLQDLPPEVLEAPLVPVAEPVAATPTPAPVPFLSPRPLQLPWRRWLCPARGLRVGLPRQPMHPSGPWVTL